MLNTDCLVLSFVTFEENPFPHFYALPVLKNQLDEKLLDWFENTNEWELTETEFYEQYEFSLLDIQLPKILNCLISETTISLIEKEFKRLFGIQSFEMVGITAHKLTSGQKIGVHNDYINGDETHRLIIQINEKWTEENGGYLLLFNSSNSKDISKVIQPLNNSAFGFEISKHSHHAVSKIYGFSRYSVVYTFKAKA